MTWRMKIILYTMITLLTIEMLYSEGSIFTVITESIVAYLAWSYEVFSLVLVSYFLLCFQKYSI